MSRKENQSQLVGIITMASHRVGLHGWMSRRICIRGDYRTVASGSSLNDAKLDKPLLFQAIASLQSTTKEVEVVVPSASAGAPTTHILAGIVWYDCVPTLHHLSKRQRTVVNGVRTPSSLIDLILLISIHNCKLI